MPTLPLQPPTGDDADLVRRSQQGDRQALDTLIKRHQPFIYNVAWKMTHSPDDAMDLTQETLLKVITKLSQYSGKSSFTTWLYRIVVNEFLQAKRRAREASRTSFDDFAHLLDTIPNAEISREEEIAQAELTEELRLSCMSGMLLCLNREQRLIYILGDTFGVDHKLGAELFGISPANFRVKLHRARKELYSFMQRKCGLVNRDNPCRCPKKTKSLIARGLVTKEGKEFNVGHRRRIADYVQSHHGDFKDIIDEKYHELYQAHPYRSEFGTDTIIAELLDDSRLMRHIQVDKWRP